MGGFFGNLFDFDHDEKLNSFERAADFTAFSQMMDDAEREDLVASTGTDLEDLEFMDEDERREALEDAGLDPDDYDF